MAPHVAALLADLVALTRAAFHRQPPTWRKDCGAWEHQAEMAILGLLGSDS